MWVMDVKNFNEPTAVREQFSLWAELLFNAVEADKKRMAQTSTLDMKESSQRIISPCSCLHFVVPKLYRIETQQK